MTTKIFNNPLDDIQITATKLRSSHTNDLSIDISKNFLVDASNISISTTSLLINTISAENYYVGNQSLAGYIAQKASEGDLFVLKNEDASLVNVDIYGDLNLKNSSKTLTVAGAATFSGSGKGVVIENDLSLNNNLNIGGIIKGPSTMTIDPASHGDNTGELIIAGNLTVEGTTTTINSTVVDISDIAIVLASNAASSSQADGAGFTISGANVSFLYSSSPEQFVSTIDISAGTFIGDLSGNVTAATGTSSFSLLNASNNVTFSQKLDVSGLDVSNNATVTGLFTANGGISISGDLITTNTDSKLFVSKSTFNIENSGNVLQSDLSNVPYTWITPPNYNLQADLNSINSAVKMEFKVNFKASPEAEQFISFRVYRNTDPTDPANIVFQDCSLGSNMGVTITNVYNGTFIDTSPGTRNPTYTLQYKLDCPSSDTIDTLFGILGGENNRNYIYLQELYVP